MASVSTLAGAPNNTRVARIAIVEEHIRLENAHDLEGVLRTFGNTARYDDEAWGEHYSGRDGVHAFYQQLMRALPDLEIQVQRRHVTDDAILVEVVIRGTQLVGAVFQQLGGESRSRSVVYTPSTRTTGWPAKRSITIAQKY